MAEPTRRRAAPPASGPRAGGPGAPGAPKSNTWHGVPKWALAAGGGVGLFFVYKWWKGRNSSSTAATPAATPAATSQSPWDYGGTGASSGGGGGSDGGGSTGSSGSTGSTGTNTGGQPGTTPGSINPNQPAVPNTSADQTQYPTTTVIGSSGETATVGAPTTPGGVAAGSIVDQDVGQGTPAQVASLGDQLAYTQDYDYEELVSSGVSPQEAQAMGYSLAPGPIPQGTPGETPLPWGTSSTPTGS